MIQFQPLIDAIAKLPSGRWAVGVSGGADSVALLHLLATRALPMVAVHLDHQLRGPESDEDAAFTLRLCQSLGVPCVIARRSELEPQMPDLPANPQARYRRLRLELFGRVIGQERLEGVILAHHADDQAQTILMRLLRGAGIEGLCGIPRDHVVHGVRLLRPMLGVRQELLRQYLTANGFSWREDSSNDSPKYLRNRVRAVLKGRPELEACLLDIAGAFELLGDWLDRHSPELPEAFPTESLQGIPAIVQLHALRRWLLNRGMPADAVTMALLDRLRVMVEDMASPHALTVPGAIEIRRKAGQIAVRHTR